MIGTNRRTKQIQYAEGDLLNEQFREDPERDIDFVHTWVERDIVEMGVLGAKVAAEAMRKFHRGYQGKILLSFSGWEEDERDIWEIPQVNKFCRYLLFSDPKTVVRAVWEESKREDDLVLTGAVGLSLLIFCAFPEDIAFEVGADGECSWRTRTCGLVRDWIIGKKVAPEEAFDRHRRNFERQLRHIVPN